MRRGLAICVAALAAGLPGLALAFIPPAPLPEVGWDGPGFVCEDAFTLAVAKDEYARINPQLELWYPLAYTVKSQRGWYTVSVEPHRPKDQDRGARLRGDRTGDLFVFKPDDTFRQLRRYAWLPRASGAPAVVIVMHPAEPQSPGWRERPDKALAPADDAGVLKRLTFGRSGKKGCLNAHRSEGR